jgi:hypothetical protein
LRGPYLAGLDARRGGRRPVISSTFDETFNSDQGLSVALEPPPGTMLVEQWQAWVCWAGALLTVLALAWSPAVASAGTCARCGTTRPPPSWPASASPVPRSWLL